MRKPTIKSTGLLLSAASLTLATLSTPPLARALTYDGKDIAAQNGHVPITGGGLGVGPEFKLTSEIEERRHLSILDNYISGYDSAATLYSNGNPITLSNGSIFNIADYPYEYGHLVIDGEGVF